MTRISPPPVVGLIPAAGFATRLGLPSTSKEVVPLAGRPLLVHLLERFACAGIEHALLVLRRGKTDVAQSIAARERPAVEVETLWTDATPSVPHTLDVAYDRLLGKRVALGFPDILFEPRDAFRALDRRQQETGCDLVLGLFPTDRPGVTDMVRLDDRGRPIDIVIKDPSSKLRYTWQVALWSETVTRHLRRSVAVEPVSARHELQVGDVLRSGLEQGLDAEAVVFDDGRCLDVGIPEALELARRVEGELERL